MSWESIGNINTGDLPGDEEWIEFGLDIALRYIKAVCGNPPVGCELAVMWSDHELGAYPSIGIYTDFEAPSDYVSACANALETFDRAVDWEALKDEYDLAREGDDD